MKITHEKTRKIIVDILGDLRGLGEKASEYRNEKIKVESNEEISRKYQQELIEKLMKDYLSNLNTVKELIKDKIGKILDEELEQEKILELDVPEFANTLNAINSSNGNLPSPVIDTIKLNFAGQYQAINIIKAVFERYGIDVNKYGYADYTKSAVADVKELLNMASNIETSEVAIYESLKNLFIRLIKFGETRGLYFTESEKSFGKYNEEEYERVVTRKAMGLSL